MFGRLRRIGLQQQRAEVETRGGEAGLVAKQLLEFDARLLGRFAADLGQAVPGIGGARAGGEQDEAGDAQMTRWCSSAFGVRRSAFGG